MFRTIGKTVPALRAVFEAVKGARTASESVVRFQLTRPDGTGIVRDGPGAGLGDVWAGLKVRLTHLPGGGYLALRGALKLPTGRLPYGSEEVDLGASLFAGWSWNATGLRAQVDVLVPTEELRAGGVETRPYGAFDVGLTQRWAIG